MLKLKKEDVEQLAALARLAISEEEKASLPKELDAVLSYVSEISKVATTGALAKAGELRNVMREDGEVYQGGEWTKAILANAPHQEDGYFKVGQIF